MRPNLPELIESELAALEQDWPRDLARGVIHADLFPDNVFFMDGKLSGLIDFYFACEDALAYDLAVCINAWCFERGGEFNATQTRALTLAEHGVKPVAGLDLAHVPLLCRGAAMRFLLTRLYDWFHTAPGALVQRKDPLEYVERIQFHRGAKSAASYGLT